MNLKVPTLLGSVVSTFSCIHIDSFCTKLHEQAIQQRMPPMQVKWLLSGYLGVS